MTLRVGDGDDGQAEQREGVLGSVLGNGHIELVACLLLEAVGNPALGLEVVIAVQGDLNGEVAMYMLKKSGGSPWGDPPAV